MTIDSKIRDFIRENFLFGSDDQVGENDSLLDRGIIDSTGAMELVSFLETEFGIEVSDRDLVPENLDSVAAITAFVTRKSSEPQQASGAARAAG
jgi:acyl carrier protein